jgi:hypothetical protein
MDKLKKMIRHLVGGGKPSKGKRTDEQELIARNLYDFLESTFREADPAPAIESDGGGVNWHVDASAGERTCRIHCFHYGHSAADLYLGLRGNTHLRTVQAAPLPEPYLGVEYLVCFREGEDDIVEGRTNAPEQVAACVTRWVLVKGTREDVYNEFSFVDKNRRALRSLAEVIDKNQARAGSEIRTTLEQGYGGDVGVELWVYGGKRSCRLEFEKHIESIGCAFLISGTQVASALFKADTMAAEAVHCWLDQSLSLTELLEKFAGLQLSDFAAQFERGDVAGWHWANVLNQARQEREAGVDEVLAYYLPILERVAAHPVMCKFFSFTSLNRLCFSRCSHYPFADSGMPMLAPAPGGYYAQCGEDMLQGDTDEICDFLSRHLSAVTKPPFHGCLDDCLIEPVNEMLKDQGSSIQVSHVQRMQWSDVVAVAGDRSCKLNFSDADAMPYGVSFWGDTGEALAWGEFFKMPTMITAMRMWLESDAPLEDLVGIADKFVLDKDT